jgi:hypothetical protein
MTSFSGIVTPSLPSQAGKASQLLFAHAFDRLLASSQTT